MRNYWKLDVLDEISEKVEFNFKGAYQRLLHKGLLTEDSLSQEDYIEIVFRAVNNGEFKKGMYLNRIDESKPFSRENIYFSYRRKVRTQKSLSTGAVSSGTCRARQFLKNWRPMCLEAKMSGYKKVENYFLKNEDPAMSEVRNSLAWHFVRLARIFTRIGKGFGSFENFVEWSVTHGYSEFTEFRNVIPGSKPGPDTCAWDYFSEASYQEFWTKTRQDLVAQHNRDHRDPYRSKLYALARRGKICEEWKRDWTLFKEWCISNGMTELNGSCRVAIIDKTKPISPDNCYAYGCGYKESLAA